jgi:phosphomannomutase / phosphoglucomutase
MLKPTIFREYDIRGVADTDLPSQGIERLGRALGTFFRQSSGVNNPRVNLGRDCRLSSDRLHDALLAGLLSTGCHVADLGTVPTPLLYFSAHHLQSDGAVMITGSHNPAEYNGFKTMLGAGTIHGEQIQHIRHIIEADAFEIGQGQVTSVDVSDAYLDAIAPQFHWDRRIKVVADAGNGTAGPLFHRLLQRLNVDAVELFFEMDGRFPNHHPDPTVEHNLEHLKQAVRDSGAELGIAFDGDSDRIGAVDEQGNVVWGDYLMLIYAREILTRKPGATFIGEVKCSQVMYDEIRARGGNAIMWKTGHSLIKAKMKQEHAELAGEMSGHIFFADRYFGFDDALYAAARLLEIVALSGRPLSAQIDGLPKLVSTPEIRFDTPDELKFDVVARVLQHFRATHEVVDVDGARILFPNGWGLVRASNTQPVLVMRFEAETPDQLAEYRATVEAVVSRALETASVARA